MWQEYAVDPVALAASWDRFCRFFDGFGWEHGRLLSRYPKRWEAMFNDALGRGGVSAVRQARMQERLRQEKRQRLISAGRDFDQSMPWLENVEAQHAANPFHAILTETNERSHPQVVCMDECDAAHTLWSSPGTKAIERSAAQFAVEARLLLARSNEILLIDPHFDPEAPRFIDSLGAFLNQVRFSDNGFKRFELHTGDSDAFTRRGASEFERRMRRSLESRLPTAARLSVDVWHIRRSSEAGERLHNRYLLTEFGGLCFPGGTDQASVAGQTEELVRLSEASRTKQWRDFQPGTAAHQQVHPRFEVVGT